MHTLIQVPVLQVEFDYPPLPFVVALGSLFHLGLFYWFFLFAKPTVYYDLNFACSSFVFTLSLDRGWFSYYVNLP